MTRFRETKGFAREFKEASGAGRKQSRRPAGAGRPPSKQYRVQRAAGGRVEAFVVIGDLVYPLPHVVRHSPTGFETGYGGSGSADLALSILDDFLRAGGRTTKRDRLHQFFKWKFIAPRRLEAGASYTITEADIRAWLANP